MRIIPFILCLFLIDSSNLVYAYFGPGVALPAILLIIGVVLAVLFLLLVIFYYPIKKFLKKRKK